MHPNDASFHKSSPYSAATDSTVDAPVVIENEAMRELFRVARRVSPTSAPVLILGETGTGKEVLAQFIHRASARPATLRSINCAALPPQLIAATLFGHERGAFTGAVKRTAGVFEQARRGTVFLDEVGELHAEAQAALLRVLETRRLSRIGSERDIEIDVRVIAATHRNLERMVSKGSFRDDLLYRLNAVTLEVPPLRDRRDEIVVLARLFLRRAAMHWRCSARELDPAAAELLVAHSWPGNIRELRNVVERGTLMCEGSTLEPRHLPTSIRNGPDSRVVVSRPSEPFARMVPRIDARLDLRHAVRRYEFELIQLALRRTGGNQRQAAKLLEIPRRTLVRKLRELRSCSPTPPCDPERSPTSPQQAYKNTQALTQTEHSSPMRDSSRASTGVENTPSSRS